MFTRRPQYPVQLWIAASFVTLFLIGCVIVRVTDWSYGADTGTFAIVIANTPHGMYDALEHASHFRFHFSPLLVALYPVLLVAHSIVTLQAIQVLLVVGSVFAFYTLVEPHAGRALALRLALLALVYPPFLGLAFSEFHEVALVPLLVLLLLIALDRRAWGWYALFATLLLGVREDVGIITGIFGVVLAVAGLRRGERDRLVAGVATASGALLVVGLYFFVVVPHLGGWGPSHFYEYPFADGPLAVARSLFTTTRLTYLLEIFVPLALLPFLTRRIYLAIPSLAVVLLANSPIVWRMGMHYTALWLPWVLLAAAAGAIHVQGRSGERGALRFVNVAIAISIVFLCVANPMHAPHYLVPSYADIGAARRAMRCVPHDASIATHDEWYTAMSLRYPRITIGLPNDARYYVFADDYRNNVFQHEMLPELRAETAKGDLRAICRFDHVVVYERRNQ